MTHLPRANVTSPEMMCYRATTAGTFAFAMVKISMPNFRIYLASSFGCLPIARRSRSHHRGPASLSHDVLQGGKAGQILNPNRALIAADDEMVC